MRETFLLLVATAIACALSPYSQAEDKPALSAKIICVWADYFNLGASLNIDWVRELHCYKTAVCMCVEVTGNHICVADLRTVAEYDNRFIPVLNSDAPCTLPGGWGWPWGF